MSGRYSAYPAYETSAAEWQEEVPAGWTGLALGRMFRRVKRSGFSDEELLSVYRDYGVIPKASRDDNFNKASEDLSPYQLVRPGDLVMNKMKAWQGSIAMSEHRGIVSPAYFVYEPWRRDDERMEQKYIHYLLRSAAYITQYLSRSKGIRVNQWDLDPGAFERIEVLLPSLEEQTQIAKFLDYETAKIDALIEKQQQLIALLKEKRQAVISHAVTKGLNPDAPMRDSGVEWLGEVPAHWNHGTKFRSLAIQQRASFTNGPFGSDLLSSEITDHGVPVIYIRDLKLEGYRRKSTSHVTKKKAEQLDKFRVDPEDLLIAKVGDPPGFCCTYPVGEPAGIICQDVIRLKPDRKLISPYFMCFLLNSDAGMEAVNSVCVELTRKRFSLADLHSLRFSIPPLDEQDAIVSEIGGRLAKLDGLLAKTNDVSVLLQERRTALICAAVTGQIDVRDWKAPNPAMEEEVA